MIASFTSVPSFLVPSKPIQIQPAHVRVPRVFPASPLADKGPLTSSLTASSDEFRVSPVVYPSIAHSNTLFFKSAYNVQVIVGENETEDEIVRKFRKKVFEAEVFEECKKRRFFESSQERRKRKARQAIKRRSRRRFQPRDEKKAKWKDAEALKKNKDADDGDDNWDIFDVELPYCQ